MNDAVISKGESGRPTRTALSVITVIGTAVILELVVLGFLATGLYAATGPCTAEYTPELQAGSPRDEICNNPGALWILLGIGALAVPVAAVIGLWRLRTTRARFGALLIAVLIAAAALVGFLVIIEAHSPMV